MPAYLVMQDRNSGGRQVIEGADAMVVFAADATAAKQACAAKYSSDGKTWLADSTTAVAVAAATDWVGWTFRIAILSEPPLEVSVVGDATNNTIDEIAALLVTALNATAAIAGAAYDASTNTLTVAATTDALGDQTLQVEFIPPAGAESIAALVGTIVDGGASGDALSVILPADNAVIPTVVAPVRQI